MSFIYSLAILEAYLRLSFLMFRTSVPFIFLLFFIF